MSKEFFGKIIQIIPAPAGMFSVYSDECDPPSEYRMPIIAIGLNDIGNLVPLEIDRDGEIIEAGTFGKFLRMEVPGL
jgi:hypothetical protein